MQRSHRPFRQAWTFLLLCLFPLFTRAGTPADTTQASMPPDNSTEILSIKVEGDTIPFTRDSTGAWPTLVLRSTPFNKQIVLYVMSSDSFAKKGQTVIYINNEPMPEFKVMYNCPSLEKMDPAPKFFTLTFTLVKHDTALWNKWYGFDSSGITVKIDVGTKQKQYSCSQPNLRVIMYKKAGLTFAFIAVAVLILLSILLAFVFKTDLILDRSSAVKKPYSLSRFQLLWWTVIIISCYILLYAIRDDFALLSKTTLILLGISASGSGFSTLIDYSDGQAGKTSTQEGKFFLYDILSDNGGISIHRYQNLIFTLIFGIIFFYKVLVTGNMPEFGQLELVLMGLSTATYVGLKTSESTLPPNNTNADNRSSPAPSDSQEDIVG